MAKRRLDGRIKSQQCGMTHACAIGALPTRRINKFIILSLSIVGKVPIRLVIKRIKLNSGYGKVKIDGTPSKCHRKFMENCIFTLEEIDVFRKQLQGYIGNGLAK